MAKAKFALNFLAHDLKDAVSTLIIAASLLNWWAALSNAVYQSVLQSVLLNPISDMILNQFQTQYQSPHQSKTDE